MAFVYRGERISAADAQKALSLGPGAYMGHLQYTQKQGYAPFSTTGERSVHKSANGKTSPGPGSYEVKEFYSGSVYQAVIDQWGALKPSVPFASYCERFKGSSASATPGPGSYNTVSRQVNKKKELRQDQGTASWLRMPSAPSIPAANQVFGYEETPSGELIMQKNPESVYRGTMKDSVGPGHYNTGAAQTHGTAWHKSNSKRILPRATTTGPAIGPGSYSETKLSIAPLYKFKQSAVFSSGTKRASFIPPSGKPEPKEEESSEEEELGVPGPGHYNDSSGFSAKQAPQGLQCFGAKSIRFRSENGETQKLGPGYYGDLRQPPTQKKPGDSRAPFSSTKIRFESKVNELPGPGAYKDPVLQGESHKKSWGRQGVFGTTEKRFVTAKEELVPGPGHYPSDAHRRVGVHNSATRKPLSVFASKSKRDLLTMKADNPAPGSYEVTCPLGAKKATLSTQPILMNLDEGMKKPVGFHSQAERFSGTGGTELKELGPGKYDPRNLVKNQSHSTMAKVFVSNAERFNRSSVHEAPGPGAYHDDNAESYWNKRSYNIYFSEIN